MPRSSRRPPLRLMRRFLGNQGGATAVEFGLVVIPFLMLIFAIFELGLVLLVSITLDSAIDDMSRQIRTGEIQGVTGSTPDQKKALFRKAVCDQMGWVGADTCADALTIDVQTIDNFASQPAVNMTKSCWDPGGASSVVLVRAFYKWPLITPLLKTGVSSTNGVRTIKSTSLFANEPYSDDEPEKVTCP